VEIQQQLESLKDKIYITRKSRIEASERYKKWDFRISIINIYYSIILIIISIVSFTCQTSEQLSIASITTAILVFGFSMVGLSMQFKDKYYSFKTCYIKLGNLIKEIETASPENYDNTYKSVYSDYLDVLDTTENHNTSDYFRYLYFDKQMLDKKVASQSVDRKKVEKSIIYGWIIKILFYLLSIIIPFIVPLIIELIRIWINSI
jgi:hypothetical protein